MDKRVIPANQGSPGLHIIVDGVMTGTNVLTSDVFNANNFDNIGLQFKWTSTAVGTLDVLASINNVDFVSLGLTLPSIAGTAGVGLVAINQLAYPYIKVKYTNTSSSGVLNVWLSAKDLN